MKAYLETVNFFFLILGLKSLKDQHSKLNSDMREFKFALLLMTTHLTSATSFIFIYFCIYLINIYFIFKNHSSRQDHKHPTARCMTALSWQLRFQTQLCPSSGHTVLNLMCSASHISIPCPGFQLDISRFLLQTLDSCRTIKMFFPIFLFAFSRIYDF